MTSSEKRLSSPTADSASVNGLLQPGDRSQGLPRVSVVF